jgi:hypothetical protein
MPYDASTSAIAARTRGIAPIEGPVSGGGGRESVRTRAVSRTASPAGGDEAGSRSAQLTAGTARPGEYTGTDADRCTHEYVHHPGVGELHTGWRELCEDQRDHHREQGLPPGGMINAPAAKAATMIGGVIAA